jgi:hypothetical protein
MKMLSAQNSGAGTLESLMYPLMFDPGDGFVYGISTDWGGVMVEHIAGRPIAASATRRYSDHSA